MSAADEAPIFAAIIDAEPYGYLQSGIPRGAYVEMTAVLSDESGVPLSPVVFPFSRAVSVVIQGAQAITFMYANDLVDRGARRVVAITRVESVVLAGKGSSFYSVQALSGSRVARLAGACQDVGRAVGQNVFVDVEHLEQGIALLKSNQVDGLCASRAAIVSVLRKTALSEKDFGPFLTTGWRDVWLYASRRLPDTTVERLKRAIASLAKRGEVTKIMGRWGEAP